MFRFGVEKAKTACYDTLKESFRELYETEESIAGIGMRVGYSNPGKFSAAFQSVMNHTPSTTGK